MTSDIYKNKIRIRVNGLLLRDEAILLAQVKSPVTNQLIWMPPGGGLQFGERMQECLAREFKEETGLQISSGPLVAINELVRPPFHAVEMYFSVKQTGGELRLGLDPEHPKEHQVLKDLQWIPFDQLDSMEIAPKALPSWLKAMPSGLPIADAIYEAEE